MPKILFTNLLVALLGVSGCTVYGVKEPPTIKSTTSAEQYERIYWKNVRDKRWRDLTPLIAPNLVYTVSGKVLTPDQVVPYLKSEQIREIAFREMVVKPNGPDMTLSYTLELTSTDGRTQSLSVVSVWQQVKGGWILIVHAEQPQAAAS